MRMGPRAKESSLKHTHRTGSAGPVVAPIDGSAAQVWGRRVSIVQGLTRLDTLSPSFRV